MILSHPLPGISPWFEVEKRELVRHTHTYTQGAVVALMLSRAQVEVSPLENAISVVENKNHELRTLISQYQHQQHHQQHQQQHQQLHANINPLSMTLNGVIDAAVNGGIAIYQEVPFHNAMLTTGTADPDPDPDPNPNPYSNSDPDPDPNPTPTLKLLLLCLRLSSRKTTSAAILRTPRRSHNSKS